MQTDFPVNKDEFPTRYGLSSNSQKKGSDAVTREDFLFKWQHEFFGIMYDASRTNLQGAPLSMLLKKLENKISGHLSLMFEEFDQEHRLLCSQTLLEVRGELAIAYLDRLRGADSAEQLNAAVPTDEAKRHLSVESLKELRDTWQARNRELGNTDTPFPATVPLQNRKTL